MNISCIDLTLASGDLARRGDSDVMDRYSIGSDNFSILSWFGRKLLVEVDEKPRSQDFGKAQWEEFAEKCAEGVSKVNSDGSVEESNESVFNDKSSFCAYYPTEIAS